MSKKMTMAEAATKGLLSEDIAEKKRAQLEQLFPMMQAPETCEDSSNSARQGVRHRVNGDPVELSAR